MSRTHALTMQMPQHIKRVDDADEVGMLIDNSR
jgi:hypothetical protein